jgi:hypothetical protein
MSDAEPKPVCTCYECVRNGCPCATQEVEKVAERIRLALCYGELDDDGVIAYYGPDGTYQKRRAPEIQAEVLSVLRPSQDGGGR